MYFGYQVSSSFFFPTRTSFIIRYSKLLRIIGSEIKKFLDRDFFSALYYNFIALEAFRSEIPEHSSSQLLASTVVFITCTHSMCKYLKI